MQPALPLSRPLLAHRSVERLKLTLTQRRWLALVMLLGGALRIFSWARPGLHPDEALYASWALRIADGSDPALLGVYVDKPPFLLYSLAALFRLAGFNGTIPPDTAWLVLMGRSAALAASLTSLALLWLIARRVYGAHTALIATTLFALSPLAARLSTTLFTDPWLLLWVLLGVWAALDGRIWLAGVAAGLAYATKQQALLFLPLLFGLTLMATPRRTRAAWAWLNGAGLIVVLVLWWDSLRWQWLPSYWERSVTTYGGLAWATPANWPEHLRQWAELLGFGLGWPLWLAVGVLLGWGWRAGRATPSPASAPARRFDHILALFVGLYLLLHWVTNLAAWDRYALLILPFLFLLLARAMVWAWARPLPQHRRRWALVLLVAGGLSAAGLALRPTLFVADGGQYDRVPALARQLRVPTAAIVYHHQLGWHFNFYLYGDDAELRWWADPADLAGKAVVATDQPQFIAVQSFDEAAAVRDALQDAGLILVPTSPVKPLAEPLTLYRILPAPAVAHHGR